MTKLQFVLVFPGDFPSTLRCKHFLKLTLSSLTSLVDDFGRLDAPQQAGRRALNSVGWQWAGLREVVLSLEEVDQFRVL